MRTLALGILALIVLPATAGCTLLRSKGNLDKASVDRLSQNLEFIAPAYLDYAAAAGDDVAPADVKAARDALVKMAKDLDAGDIADYREKVSKIFPKYLVYVRGDPHLSASEKETEEDLVASTKRLIDSIEKRVED